VALRCQYDHKYKGHDGLGDGIVFRGLRTALIVPTVRLYLTVDATVSNMQDNTATLNRMLQSFEAATVSRLAEGDFCGALAQTRQDWSAAVDSLSDLNDAQLDRLR
jgi:hypothetical protein